jgi:hypothetical protein
VLACVKCERGTVRPRTYGWIPAIGSYELLVVFACGVAPGCCFWCFLVGFACALALAHGCVVGNICKHNALSTITLYCTRCYYR